MTQQYKGDSFSPFLRSMKKHRSAREGEARVLALLQKEPEHQMPVEVLRKRATLALVEFGQILEKMQEGGLLLVEGALGQEIVRLTPGGEVQAQRTQRGK